MDEAGKKILSSLESRCARREYCSRDILHKAALAIEKAGADVSAGELLSKLVEEGYVDDARYAGAFAREKSGLTGWGPAKIRFFLSAKGIARETIAAALADTDQDRSSERLRKLLETKARALKGDPDIKLKLLRFALGRGYEYDSVKEPVDSAVKALQEAED